MLSHVLRGSGGALSLIEKLSLACHTCCRCLFWAAQPRPLALAASSDMQKIFIPTQPSLSIFSLLIPCISSKLRKAALSRGGMNIKFYLILTFLGPYFFLIYLTLIQMEFSSMVGVGELQWAEYLQGGGTASSHPPQSRPPSREPEPTPNPSWRSGASAHTLSRSKKEHLYP